MSVLIFGKTTKLSERISCPVLRNMQSVESVRTASYLVCISSMCRYSFQLSTSG
jgi:hypothetical protein